MLRMVLLFSYFYISSCLNVYKNDTVMHINEYIPHWAKRCYIKSKGVNGIINDDIDYHVLEHVTNKDLYHIYKNAMNNNSSGILVSSDSIDGFYERPPCQIPIAFINHEYSKYIDAYDRVQWSVDRHAEYIQIPPKRNWWQDVAKN